MTLQEHIENLQLDALTMNPSQRGLLAARLKADLSNNRASVTRRNGKVDCTREAVRALDVSLGTISAADRVLRCAPDEIFELVESGQMTLNNALKFCEDRRPRLQALTRCWRLCSPQERREFFENLSGTFSETIVPRAAEESQA